LFSLASDDADDDLLPKAFRVTHFFYVDSNPRVLNHLFFDDGGKPSAVPLVIGSYYSGPSRSAYGKRKVLRGELIIQLQSRALEQLYGPS
jgi:hypothetical protein